jgi:gliding motility-associated-like protein
LVNNANLSNPLVNIDESTTFTLLRIPKNNTTVCPGKDTLHVHIPPGSPLAQFTTELTASCTEVYVSISNTSEFASTHQWDFGLGSGNQEIEPKITYAYGDSIIITLIVENEFCRDTLTYIQPLSALESYFKMNNSNAFSPNGDGLNDCFSPAMQDLPSPEDKNFLPCTSLYIYDRWGKPIFEAIEIVDGCWDGTNAAGEEMPDGVYFYLFKGQGKEVQGSVSLLR